MAASNVATSTERRIQKAMWELMRYKTCSVIAHRLSTIQLANYILTIDHKKVVNQGNREGLMERKGVSGISCMRHSLCEDKCYFQVRFMTSLLKKSLFFASAFTV